MVEAVRRHNGFTLVKCVECKNGRWNKWYFVFYERCPRNRDLFNYKSLQLEDEISLCYKLDDSVFNLCNLSSTTKLFDFQYVDNAAFPSLHYDVLQWNINIMYRIHSRTWLMINDQKTDDLCQRSGLTLYFQPVVSTSCALLTSITSNQYCLCSHQCQQNIISDFCNTHLSRRHHQH